MKRIDFIRFAIALLVGVALLTVPSLWAQSSTSTATLSGTVSDPTGARVPDATVTMASSELGVTRQFKTNSVGEFSFALLPPATYTLTVQAHGFMTSRQQGIALRVGDSLTVNVSLTVGASEQVTVTAATPLLQTDSSNVSTEVSSRQLQNLPLNLRNVTGLVLLNSSVNNQTQQQILAAGGAEDTADQDESFLSFGGGFFGTTAWILDGGWNVAMGWGGVVYVPSVDDVQEFKVQTNSFSAQYGWSTGNVVNVITKSGTSDFHGVAYEYLRNQALDANTFFNNRNGILKTPDHRNQFGVAGGGPLYLPWLYRQRNKTFFFANYEGLRLNNAGIDNENMPTTAQLGGDFSAELGSQLGTDALGRPVYAGQIYNPYTTRQVTATSGPNAGQTVTIRDPYPGNIIPASGVGAIDPRSKIFAGGNFWPGP
ncbi:MAG: carboxypeptidase regulatory-like domain-containing protein, partial [Acidobacteriota bacterium]